MTINDDFLVGLDGRGSWAIFLAKGNASQPVFSGSLRECVAWINGAEVLSPAELDDLVMECLLS